MILFRSRDLYPLHYQGKLPSLLPAAADGQKAVSARPVEGLPSLIPVASEPQVVSPTAKETAPQPTATTPKPVPVVSVPPTATQSAPIHESTTAAKAPEPTKAVEPTKTVEKTTSATGTPEPSEAGSTLKEKVAYGADELGRNANSTPGSTLRSKKKRGSLLTRIKSVFHPDKEKEKAKK